MSEWVSEWVSERVSGWANKQTSEWASVKEYESAYKVAVVTQSGQKVHKHSANTLQFLKQGHYSQYL